MALVYLINKPQVLGKIARWLLLFLEYDFIVVYKPRKIHVVVDALSRLLDITKPIDVLNQTTNASLFYIELEWLNDVKEFLRTRHIEGMLSIQHKQKLVKKAKPFTMNNGELYRMVQDIKLQ
jgi:hypothetical protein